MEYFSTLITVIDYVALKACCCCFFFCFFELCSYLKCY